MKHYMLGNRQKHIIQVVLARRNWHISSYKAERLDQTYKVVNIFCIPNLLQVLQ
jgi:hypothetical protein